ncbi:MAG TPA: alpha/beta fold hydrolase [Candidatus Limnocylindria bacterium]|nr:alpha/beta fold hydrolase [Candidatus Limnocylindria bacterium]
MTAVELASDGERLNAELYGSLPADRAVVLCHGQSWDASGWRDIAPRFVERGVPALALNFRGFGGSSGTTGKVGSGPRASSTWTTVTDLAAAKAWLTQAGAREIGLVGASMGGHAVLGSSFERDVECVVSISAPVEAIDDALARKVTGRKLFICATEDHLGAAPHVRHTFDVCAAPKTLLMVDGTEHSRPLLDGPHGADLIAAMVDFVAGRR